MECLGVYYSYNPVPNDAEIKGCCDIASKFKHPVLLYFACTELTNDTSVKHVFIFKDDTVESVRSRISAAHHLV